MTNQLELPDRRLDTTSTALAFTTLFIAVVSLSMAGILIRFSEAEISPISTAFNRLWIATLVFGIWNGVNSTGNRIVKNSTDEDNTPYTVKIVGLLLACATVASVALVLWNWSLTQTNIANATVLRNSNALFTPLLGWLLFGQRYDKKFLMGMILAIAGIIARRW